MNRGRPSRRFPAGAVAAVALGALTPIVQSCTPDIRVGAIVSRTGAAAVYGESVRKGLELAAAELAADPGPGGARMSLLFRDDATHPELGARAAEELIDGEHVGIVIGAVTSSVTLRIAAICEKRGVVLLSPSASAPAISEAGEYVFRNFPSDLFEGTSIADFARDLGLDRIVVLSVANEYGAGLRKAFLDRFEKEPGRIAGAFIFAEGDAARLAALAEQVRSLRPRGVFIAGYAADTALLLRGLRDAGENAVLLGTSSAMPDLPRAAGAAAEHFVFPQPSFDADSDDPAVRSFVEAYRARYHEEPDVYAAHGYDALRIIQRAIARAGSSRPDAIRDILLRMNDFRGAAGRTAFDPRGDVVRYARMFVVEGGVPVPYERFVERGGALAVPPRATFPVPEGEVARWR